MGAIGIRDLPNPGAYARRWREFTALTRAGTTVSIHRHDGRALDADGFRREMWEALERRINARVATPALVGRKHTADYQIRLYRDCQRVRDHATRRVSCHGLETREIRRRFGHIVTEWPR